MERYLRFLSSTGAVTCCAAAGSVPHKQAKSARPVTKRGMAPLPDLFDVLALLRIGSLIIGSPFSQLTCGVLRTPANEIAVCSLSRMRAWSATFLQRNFGDRAGGR